MFKILRILVPLLMASVLINAEGTGTKSTSQVTGVSDIRLDINRLNGIFRNNGISYFDVIAGNWGLEWPKGSNNSPIFASGPWIAAIVDSGFRAAGILHSASDYQPGKILSPDIPDNPDNYKNTWYQIFSDNRGDLTNWPFEMGAPYQDLNKNGTYDFGEPPFTLGDQTLFCVYNDLTKHVFFKNDPLAAEIQQTIFAFNRNDIFGDMHFFKWRVVNKGNSPWDSTFFSFWVDADLGGASDDLIGCDSSLGLAFTYNYSNEDHAYGTAPPAQGCVYLQGPVVDKPGSQILLPGGEVLLNKKIQLMTSFTTYQGSADPVYGVPTTARGAWNYLSGNKRDGQPFTIGGHGRDPSNPPTRFLYSGDPETEQGTGWLDSYADDRRFMINTGPFDMPVWQDLNGNGLADFGEPGVQDIVMALVLTRGSDNLNSVTRLKEIAALLHQTYANNFLSHLKPVQPEVNYSEGDRQVLISWDERSEYNADGGYLSLTDPIAHFQLGDTVTLNQLQRVIDDDDYNFYGYSLYQYADAQGTDPVKVVHWDSGKISDPQPYSGGPRHFLLEENHHPASGVVGTKLTNGRTYYFGLVAEAWLEFGNPQIIESNPTIVSVQPRFLSGERFSSAYNDTLEVTHSGKSKGSVTAIVADPSKTTGLEYTVTFNKDLSWNLINETGDTVAENQQNLNGDDAYNIYDGIWIKVAGQKPGIDLIKNNGWDYKGDRWVSGTNWGAVTFFGGLDIYRSFWAIYQFPDFEITDINMLWAGVSDRSDSTADGLAAASMVEYPERWSKAVVYRRDLGYAVQSTLGDIPFAVYDTWQNPRRRLKIAFVEDAENGSANLLWDMGWDSSVFSPLGGREYIFILNDSYDTNYTDYLNGTTDGLQNNVMYMIWPNSRGSRPYLHEPFEMQIFATKPNTPDDFFTFTAPAKATRETADIKDDLKKIKVVPNPYYAFNAEERTAGGHWVQFTYLPEKCTIYIFDLAGNRLRKLEKDDPDTPFFKWDLRNAFNKEVGSGIFLYHVDAGKLGKRTGKIALFMPAQ